MKKQHFTYLTGKLIFSSKKVLLQVHEKEYFVLPRSLSFGEFLHGDIVRAKLVQTEKN
jgi:homogentisate 1,2-dioxygenase